MGVVVPQEGRHQLEGPEAGGVTLPTGQPPLLFGNANLGQKELPGEGLGPGGAGGWLHPLG